MLTRMARGTLLCCFAAAIACNKPAPILLAPSQPAAGRLQVLDSGGDEGDTGWWPQVLFDHHDKPHVAFCDARQGDVRYAEEDAHGWHVRSLVEKGAVGKYLAMAVNANDRIALTYYNQDHAQLHYFAQNAHGDWDDEVIAYGREVGMGAELLFDHNNVPHLFYYVGRGALIHAVRDSHGEWQKTVLAQAQTTFSVRIQAVERADGIWLSYVDWKAQDAALYLGHITDDGFSHEVVADRYGPGWHSQLAFLGDAPMLIHSARLTAQTDLARREANAWVSHPLLPHGSNFAASLYQNRWVVAYQDTSDIHSGGTLMYTRQTDGAWQTRRIDDTGPIGRYVSMAVSSTGRMLVVYYADVSRSVKIYDEALPSTN